MKIEISV